MDQYLLGDILVEMNYGGMEVLAGGNLQKFRYQKPWNGDRVTFRCQFEPLDGYLSSPQDRRYHAYRHGEINGEHYLIYHWGNQYNAFIVWPDRFSVSFSPQMRTQRALREDWFFSVISFHRQLLLRNAFVMHASYVDIGGEAILFSGPSGVGKSTQAQLWQDHSGARLINGDRALVRQRNGVWNTFGYPCCGTSGVSLNETMPLRAVVLLAQAKKNRVEEIPASQKIRGLVSAMELYPWEKKELEMAFSIAETIGSQIPVIKLHCRPDADAVAVLKEYLEDKSCHDSI